MRRRTSKSKLFAAAALMMFGAGAASTPSLAQDDPPYCWQWARDYCASIGAGGNPQCITYWNHYCEVHQGFAPPSLNAVRPD
jgi:hypothetical protein